MSYYKCLTSLFIGSFEPPHDMLCFDESAEQQWLLFLQKGFSFANVAPIVATDRLQAKDALHTCCLRTNPISGNARYVHCAWIFTKKKNNDNIRYQPSAFRNYLTLIIALLQEQSLVTTTRATTTTLLKHLIERSCNESIDNCWNTSVLLTRQVKNWLKSVN